jgi:hypothetical protein
VRRTPDRLARWPWNAVWKILSEAKACDPFCSACVEEAGHRYFECDEFRTRCRQQVKKLKGAPRVLRTCIRSRHLDAGCQVKSAKFASGVPAPAALL